MRYERGNLYLVANRASYEIHARLSKMMAVSDYGTLNATGYVYMIPVIPERTEDSDRWISYGKGDGERPQTGFADCRRIIRVPEENIKEWCGYVSEDTLGSIQKSISTLFGVKTENKGKDDGLKELNDKISRLEDENKNFKKLLNQTPSQQTSGDDMEYEKAIMERDTYKNLYMELRLKMQNQGGF